MRGIAKVATAALVFILMVPAARAEVDRNGYYELFRDGVRIGSERYTWVEGGGDGVVMRGECVRELDGASTTLRPSLTLDSATLVPVSIDIERNQGGTTSQVHADFEGSRAHRVVVEDGMESKKTQKIRAADLVVDPDIAYMFLVLARRYDFDRGGEQDFGVYDASTGADYTAHARLRGLGTYETDKGSFRTRRLTIDLDNVSVDLYVDRYGRVPEISIPMLKVDARLVGYDGTDNTQQAAGGGASDTSSGGGLAQGRN